MGRFSQRCNLEIVEKHLKRFDEIWEQARKTQVYSNSGEMKNIAKKLNSMKLRDDFLVSDLNEKQKEILEKVLIIANL